MSSSPVIDDRPEIAALRDRIDPDARDVVARLREAGHEAYLVGGCVRDLLLGLPPKDFDLATSAHPSEIRMLLRNCRLIGRRFRLAHIYFRGGKIIETATFRANPLEEMDEPPADLLLSQDNVFGTAEQDARRRDFTVNGMFYEPESGRVIDYVGGLEDLQRRTLRLIGDPSVRIQEDPVRILRAARFAARLSFDVGPRTYDAMRSHVQGLQRCATARLVEEIQRLVHCGAARRAVDLAIEVGAIGVLLPELGQALESRPEARSALMAMLHSYDAARARGYLGSNALAWSLLVLPLTRGLEESEQLTWIHDVLQSIGERLKTPKRDRETVETLGTLVAELGRRPRTERAARALVRRAAFGEALVLRTLELHAAGQPLGEIGEWKAIARNLGVAIEALPGAPRPGERAAARSRSHRGGRRPRGGRGAQRS
ncbi:MAG: polynucleotide adenylyltransferase PcnB [Pseudomonadota bacterium]